MESSDSFSVASSINPVTGVVEEDQPNPMEGMSEEQKEYEAMKLVSMFNKLSRSVQQRSRSCKRGHSHSSGLLCFSPTGET